MLPKCKLKLMCRSGSKSHSLFYSLAAGTSHDQLGTHDPTGLLEGRGTMTPERPGIKRLNACCISGYGIFEELFLLLLQHFEQSIRKKISAERLVQAEPERNTLK